jgi:DNA-binding XRE family transcriptional regulator
MSKGLGRRIAQVRGAKSQGEFAQEFGTTQASLSDWERERVNPPLAFLAALSTHYSVDLNWLVAGTPGAGAVKESTAGYYTRADVRQIAEQLSQHPILLGIVRRALAADEKLPQLARDMASALGISEEAAYLKLLEMKKGPS